LFAIAACARVEYIIKQEPKRIELQTTRQFPVYVVEPYIDTIWVLVLDSAGLKTFRAETDTLWYCDELGDMFRLQFRRNGK
jgi:hypothetical protein